MPDEPVEQIVRELKRKRGSIKGRLTNFTKYVSGFEGKDLSVGMRTELKLRMQGACTLFTEFNSIQNQLEENLPESEISKQILCRESFENDYYGTLARVQCMINDEEVSKHCKSPCKLLDSVKMPTITLPTFDGSSKNWLEFRNNFLSLVHERDATNVEKFHYLKSSLKGSAALVIESIEFTSENYTIAWELLRSRYDNSRLIVHNHVKELFSIPVLTRESPESIRKLIDTILKNLRALKLLGEPTDQWDTLIVFMIISKLDSATERDWEHHKCTLLSKFENSDSKIKLDDLTKFLSNKADMLETLTVTHTKVKSADFTKQNSNSQSVPKVHCNVATDKHTQKSGQFDRKSCYLCSAKHLLYACPTFLNYNLQERVKFIRDKRLCENCLRSGHSVGDCRYGPCRKCDVKHNSLIHDDSLKDGLIHTTALPNTYKPSAVSPVGSSGAAAGAHAAPVSTNISTAQSYSIQVNNARTDTFNTHAFPSQPILLSTAVVEIVNSVGMYQRARAVLDNGSERCFITQSLCDQLKTPRIQSTQKIRGVGNSITQCTQTCDIELKSLVSNFSTRIQCLVLPRITSTLPTVTMQSSQFCVPDGVQLADPWFFESQPIDLLLGADIFWDLLSEGKMRLPNGPFLQNTMLGWVVSGPVFFNSQHPKHVNCNFTQSIDMQAIDTQLRRFWEIEELPIGHKLSDTRTEEERACEEHFVQTTTRADEGRFNVRIPYKHSPDTIGETRTQAEQCFYALEKRLQRNAEYKRMYSDFIKEYIDLGHMTRIDSYGTPYYFLPHHGVFREQATTTRLRVVFNASFPSTNGTSFNDLQLVGPPIQGDLIAILLRFREYRYVACADVEKMFRQVTLDPRDRGMHLIMWRDNPSDPLGVYQLNTVTYGTASAPYLSCRCIKQLAQECSDPEVAKVIQEDVYVDDLIHSSPTVGQLSRVCREAISVLQSGCFPLRKWFFNFDCPEFTEKVTNISKELASGEQSHSKTLGLGWYNQTDELHFHTKHEHDSKPVTKRTILSISSQIFDPLGLLSPAIMIAKVLLQKLWLLKLDWDEPVPEDVTQVWSRFINNLYILGSLRVPRYVMGIEPTRIELHVFTDASQTAYGACAYIRTIGSNMCVTVRLLSSKGRVAPISPVSIPRLELCGAQAGARLYAKIRESLRCSFDKVVFWTDSTIVLGWLRMPPNLLKTFVQNRTAEIHELSKEHSWRHVSGKNNPADLVSRGSGLDTLRSSSLWWEGPQFLHDPEFDCSVTESGSIPDDTQLPELKIKPVQGLVSRQTNESLFPFSRFSQFNRMRAAAAYVLRFIYNTRNKCNRRTGALSVEELNESVTLLARLSQQESFSDVHGLISQNKSLRNIHAGLSKLNLFVDNNNLLRVGGRIENSIEFNFDKKHPVLLSAKHRVAVLLFRHEHEQLFHAAPQQLLFNLRERWWPVGGRNLAKVVVHRCVTCARMRGKTLSPIMGNLPQERLEPGFPFLRCGVDYAGPVLILNRKGRGAKTVKAYICLFICFITRAVHLELVSDLSSDAYLLALKRFISRRGKPTDIFSDNGTNFQGLMKDFAHFLSTVAPEIKEYATSQNINFKMIPPYASHFGGLWEAGVKSCKHHLRRVVGNAHLTFEEFSTVLTQVEAILNSRPLSPMSTDPQDFLPLSPAHFLIGRPLTSPVCVDLNYVPEHRLTRYQRVEQIRQHFWTRWSKEYVSELQTRNKWKDSKDDLKQDTLVLIKDDNQPPLKWSLGRIVKTYPGRDGISRVADIRTSTKIVRRAFSKICPLPTDDNESPAVISTCSSS